MNAHGQIESFPSRGRKIQLRLESWKNWALGVNASSRWMVGACCGIRSIALDTLLLASVARQSHPTNRRPPSRPVGVCDLAESSRTILPGVTHDTQPYANNRAENSHQLTRMRERQMRRSKSPRQAQRSLSLHGVRNLFCVGRHLLRSAHHQLLRSRSFEVWRTITAV